MKSQDRLQREKYMIGLFQQLNPSELVTLETKINGTTIEKLCEFNAGGYKRVISWLEENQMIHEEDDLETDPIEEFLLKALSLYRERKGKYGDSWKVLTPETTANLIEMKAYRARTMGRENAKSLDEALDMCNYAAMLYVLLNKKQ